MQYQPAAVPVVAAITVEYVASFDECREIAGQGALLIVTRGQQQCSETRMSAQCQHAPSCGSDAAFGINGTQGLQEGTACRHRAGWWRIGETQLSASPGCQFQRKTGEIDGEDFRCTACLESLAAMPEAITPAFGHTTGATGTLVGGGLRDQYCGEARETRVGIEARFSREAAVDNHAHTGQGDGRLGDVGGEDYAAASAGVWCQRCGLLFHWHLAMQREDHDVAGQGCELAQYLLDLALPGQEHQQVAGVVRQRLLHTASYLQRQHFVALRREVVDGHRVGAAFAGDTLGIKESGEALAVE